MDILKKCLMFVFCQRGRAEDHQIQTYAVEQEQQEQEQQQQEEQQEQQQQEEQQEQHQEQQEQEEQQEDLPPAAEVCPGRGIPLEGGSRASHSPARLEVISISVDVHRQPDVVQEPPRSTLSICKRNSGLAIEDDIENLASMQHFKAPVVAL